MVVSLTQGRPCPCGQVQPWAVFSAAPSEQRYPASLRLCVKNWRVIIIRDHTAVEVLDTCLRRYDDWRVALRRACWRTGRSRQTTFVQKHEGRKVNFATPYIRTHAVMSAQDKPTPLGAHRETPLRPPTTHPLPVMPAQAGIQAPSTALHTKDIQRPRPWSGRSL